MKMEEGMIDITGGKPEKARFMIYYNAQKNSPKELFDGKCIMVRIIFTDNDISTSFRVFDSSKEFNDGFKD